MPGEWTTIVGITAIRLLLAFSAVTVLSTAVHAKKFEKAEILYVVDGDTIKVRFHGKEENVRLLGIDTPESKNNAKARKDADKSGEDVYKIIRRGQLAFCHLVLTLKDADAVELEFDGKRRGKYGRLLAYVWHNGQLLNLELVKSGHAKPLFYGRSKHKRKIERTHKKAKKRWK